MKNTCDAIVIGGGIIGAATGYYLAKSGLKVYLFEKDFPCSGSTGRCIGGIRQQFSHELSIQVMLESVKLFANLDQEFSKPVEWYQGGYLFLAHSETKKQAYLQAIAIQKKYGLPVEFISVEDCLKLVPGLYPDGLIGAAYCPTDGQANPFLVTYGYLDGIKRFKGQIFDYTEVVKINLAGNQVRSVRTNRGEEFYSPVILNAAGPFSQNIGKMIGLDIPIYPDRHESLVTEACERIFDPMLVDYRSDGCYFVQNYGTGHFIGCYTPVPIVPGERIDATDEFLSEMPHRMVRLLPALKRLKVIRQWAGSYEMTPDGNPIVDKTPIDGFYISSGMCGHGFMFGPALAKFMAEMIIKGKSSIPLDDFALDREFKKAEAMK